MIYLANRASAVLYDYLSSIQAPKPFLLPSNVCPVVPLSFLKAGVDFEFVDIDATHAMSKEQCITKLETGNYSGLLFVHAYGKKFDNTAFYAYVKALNESLQIIDDCCLCIPDTTEDMPQNIDLQLFSTGYAKYVELSYGGYGKSRFIGMNRNSLDYDKESEIKQQVYIKQCFKGHRKYKLDPNLSWIDFSPLKMSKEEYFSIIEQKKTKIEQGKAAINTIYNEMLPKSIQVENEFNNWRYLIMVNNQQKVLDAIFENGLFAGTNFPSVSYMFKSVVSPIAENEASHIINLFNDFRISEEQALKICKIINQII